MNVSVCMATYNGEQYITRQLESILSQLNASDEVIISDDSSTDRTVAIINDINDPRIKLLEHNTFKSPIFNFENALKNCTGDYIFLADQDDVWHPEKVSVTVELLNRYDLVVSDCYVVNANEQLLHESFFKLRHSGKGLLRNLYKNTYLGCCMAFNRSILEKALPFPKNIPMHDIWLGIVAELHGNPYFLDKRLVSYRRHSGTASVTAQKNNYDLIKQVKFRANALQNILHSLIKS